MSIHSKIHRVSLPAKSGIRLLLKRLLAANPLLPFSLFLLAVGIAAGLVLTLNSTELRQQAAYAGCIPPAVQIVGGVEDGGCRCPNGQVVNPDVACPSSPTAIPPTKTPYCIPDGQIVGYGGVCCSGRTYQSGGSVICGAPQGSTCNGSCITSSASTCEEIGRVWESGSCNVAGQLCCGGSSSVLPTPGPTSAPICSKFCVNALSCSSVGRTTASGVCPHVNDVCCGDFAATPVPVLDNGCSANGGVCKISCGSNEITGSFCSGSSSGPRCCYPSTNVPNATAIPTKTPIPTATPNLANNCGAGAVCKMSCGSNEITGNFCVGSSGPKCCYPSTNVPYATATPTPTKFFYTVANATPTPTTSTTIVVTPAITNLTCTVSGDSRCIDGVTWRCPYPFAKYENTGVSCNAPSFSMNALPGETVGDGARGVCDSSKSNTCSLGARCISGQWVAVGPDDDCYTTRPYVVPITQNTLPPETQTCPLNARECVCEGIIVSSTGEQRQPYVVGAGEACANDAQIAEVVRQPSAGDIVNPPPTIAGSNTNYIVDSTLRTNPTVNYQSADPFDSVPKGIVEGLCNMPFLGPCNYAEVLNYSRTSISNEDYYLVSFATLAGISPELVDSSNRLFYCNGLTDAECAAYRDPSTQGFVNRLGDASTVGITAVSYGQGLMSTYDGLNNYINGIIPTTPFSSTHDWWNGTGAYDVLPEGYVYQPLYGGRLSGPLPVVETVPLTLESIGIRPLANKYPMARLSNEDENLVHMINMINNQAGSTEIDKINSTVYNYVRNIYDDYPGKINIIANTRSDLTNAYFKDWLASTGEGNVDLLPPVGDFFASSTPAHLCSENVALMCGLLAQQDITADYIQFRIPRLNSGHGVAQFTDPTTGLSMIADPSWNLVLPYDEYIANRTKFWGGMDNFQNHGPLYGPTN